MDAAQGDGSLQPGTVTLWKKLFFSLVLCGGLVVATEVLIRCYDAVAALGRAPDEATGGAVPGLTIKDPFLQYRLKPGYAGRTLGSDIGVSSVGFRGDEFAKAKSPGRFRIVTMGDSTTFGAGASTNASTYPAQLEKLLRHAFPKLNCEVINAGIPGYNSLQVLILLETEILELKPDLVIIFIGWNDLGASTFDPWRPNYAFGMDERFRRVKKPRSLLRRAVAQSRVAVKLYLMLFEKRKPTADDLIRRAEMAEYPLNKEAVDVYRRNLRSIVNVLKGERIRCLLVTWPSFLDREMPYEAKKLMTFSLQHSPRLSLRGWYELHGLYDRAIREVGEELNVPVVDNGKLFPTENRHRLFVDVAHLTDEGNAILAGNVLETMKQHRLLPSDA